MSYQYALKSRIKDYFHPLTLSVLILYVRVQFSDGSMCVVLGSRDSVTSYKIFSV